MVAVSLTWSQARNVVLTGTAKALTWLIPMLLSAGAAAWLSYVYNQKANIALVAQQQRVNDLQQFRVSGASLDQALGDMSDALADGKGLDPARRAMRASINRNISDGLAARHLLGAGTDHYISGLADLRVVVDDTDEVQSGTALWQSSINLMKERRDLIAAAEAKASL